MDRKRGVNNSENRLLYDPNQRKQRRLGTFSMEENTEDVEENNEELEEETADGTETTDNGVQQESPTSEGDQSALGENIKSAASGAKNVAKDAAKTAAKQAGKAVGKVVGAIGKKLLLFIISNPWVLLVLGIALLLLIIILILAGDSEAHGNDYYENCSAISISTTSLSKSEFVSKVQEYFGDSTDSDRQTFAQNADKIYTIATNNGVNPELVVIRAVAEGFSPGASKNNYWGMGCTNTGGYNACITYSSFDDGVLSYVENISQYESVDKMMSRYAYIGSYWYNPGSSAVGGCYYFPYIKEFMSSSRASQVERICNSGKYCDINGGDCVSTTDEDQEAYSKYQVSVMADLRKTIFGIDPDNCEQYAPGCTIYAQGDSRWGSIHLGNSSLTMYDSGCAVTSIAIGISCSGTAVTVENFDAKAFIDTLNANSCFTSSGAIYWGCSGIQEIAPNVSLAGIYYPSSSAETKELVESQDPSNTFVLMHFENSAHPRGHYVVYTNTEGNYFVTKDPAGGKVSKLLISEVDQIVVYSY